jgi:hypothetical protein
MMMMMVVITMMMMMMMRKLQGTHDYTSIYTCIQEKNLHACIQEEETTNLSAATRQHPRARKDLSETEAPKHRA